MANPFAAAHSPGLERRLLLIAAGVATLFAGGIAGIGMAASFHTVSLEMVPSFGPGWAWAVPAILDLTVGTFSLLEIVLLYLDLPHLLARVAVYAATAGTVYLNTRAVTGHTPELAHGAMPSVWVVYIELLRGAAAARARRGHDRGPNRLARWILSPHATFTAWRSKVLLPSSPAAVGQFQTEHAQPGARALPPDEPLSGSGRGHSQQAVVLSAVAGHPDWSNVEIARHLGLSSRTVRRHRYGR